MQRMHGRLFVVEVEIGINEVFLRQPFVICLEQFGIICHDGTVIMIDGIVLVEIVTLAGVEDEIHALVEKGLDVSVHEFGGIAGGVRSDGVLSSEIQLARAAVGKDDAESAGLEKLRPQRELFEHDQLHGQSHRPARAFALRLRQREQLFILIGVNIGQVFGHGQSCAALALVAGKKSAPVRKGENVDVAPRRTPLAGDGARGI